MAVIHFTHVGKASVAVNPQLVFCIESYNEGHVGAYTRIRSSGEAHIDVKEPFSVVMELLAGPKLVEEPAPVEESEAQSDSWSSSSLTDSAFSE